MDAAILGPHGAELVHLKHAATVSGALLAVEHRAVVLHADGQSRHKQDGRRQNQAEQGDENVACALNDAFLKAQLPDGAEHQGLVVKHDALPGHSNHVGHLQAVIHVLAGLIAVLHQVRPLTDGKLIQKDGIRLVHAGQQVRLIQPGHLLDVILLLIAADLPDEVLDALPAAGHHQAALGLVDLEVQIVSAISHDDHQGYLQQIDRQQQQRPLIHEMASVDDGGIHDAQQKMRNQIRQQQHQGHGEHDGLALTFADVETAINLGHQHINHNEGHRSNAQGAAGPQQEEIFQAKQSKKTYAAQQKCQQLH